MFVQVRMAWVVVSVAASVAARGISREETGTVVEKVILTALFAGLAISVGAIIIAKVTQKAHSINLNN